MESRIQVKDRSSTCTRHHNSQISAILRINKRLSGLDDLIKVFYRLHYGLAQYQDLRRYLAGCRYRLPPVLAALRLV
ncbi:MAG: hypothetical protein P8X79_10350 [Reinekea sp.]